MTISTTTTNERTMKTNNDITTTNYNILAVDSETTPAWMALCSRVKPHNQDGGRCWFLVETETKEALELALEADDSVITYAETYQENF